MESRREEKAVVLYDVKKRLCKAYMGATLECNLHPIGDKAPYNYRFIQKGEPYYELAWNGILTICCAKCYITAKKAAAAAVVKCKRT